MAAIAVGPTRYRACTICRNAVPVREVHVPGALAVDISRCAMCDTRKCEACFKASGVIAYVADPTARRCGRGHELMIL